MNTLPDGLVSSLERQTGRRVVGVVPRAGGGASRRGAEILLQRGDGDVERGYLSWDDRLEDPLRRDRYDRECAVLAALSGPLADRGVRAPRLLATEPARLALLTRMLPGSDKFASIRDHEERDRVASDFLGQLVALHAIDARSAPVVAFGDPATPPSERIGRHLDQLKQRNLATVADPVLLLAIGWAQRNIPEDHGHSVIVHGDAGPGNFMHEDGRVTGLIDWEMAHYGDPAEDLAQIWVRSLFQPFVSPRQMLAGYRGAGGRVLDVERVRFHRLYFQLSFTVDRQASMDGFGPPGANIGNNLLYHTIHMRVIVQQLAEFAGIALPAVSLPESPPVPGGQAFDVALDDLRDVIAPRTTDEQAKVKVKSLARMLKYWRARDRFGAAADAAEVAAINAALRVALGTVTQARAALAQAILAEQIDWEAALRLCHLRVMHENELMGDALGSLKNGYFTPLD